MGQRPLTTASHRAISSDLKPSATNPAASRIDLLAPSPSAAATAGSENRCQRRQRGTAGQLTYRDPFPVTSTGDAKIEADVNLPSPCIAPIVFVGPSPAAWFAVTGTG